MGRSRNENESCEWGKWKNKLWNLKCIGWGQDAFLHRMGSKETFAEMIISLEEKNKRNRKKKWLYFELFLVLLTCIWFCFVFSLCVSGFFIVIFLFKFSKFAISNYSNHTDDSKHKQITQITIQWSGNCRVFEFGLLWESLIIITAIICDLKTTVNNIFFFSL